MFVLAAILLISAPDFKPGTNFGYSHTDYVILGGVLEKITGMPLNTAMRKYIFKPMGLTQTFYVGTASGSGHKA